MHDSPTTSSSMMHRTSILFALYALLSLVIAASPPSFCKCTCFGNSTIVDLDSGNLPTDSSSSSSTNLLIRALQIRAGNGGASCSKCNRAFCLSQGIEACKAATEKDVFTTCFQRDSRKDQIIVLLFIAVTVGLLVWAAVRKLLEKRREKASATEGLGHYAPVGGS